MKLQTVGEEALSAYYDVAKNLSINFSPMFGTLLEYTVIIILYHMMMILI